MAFIEPSHDTLRAHVHYRAESRTVANPGPVAMPVVKTSKPVIDDVFVLILDWVILRPRESSMQLPSPRVMTGTSRSSKGAHAGEMHPEVVVRSCTYQFRTS